MSSTRICKICGKEYPYCKTVLKNGEIFRWQDVACSEEHGAEYFAQVMASRSDDKPVAQENKVVAKEIVYDDEFDYDEEDDNDFEDDDDLYEEDDDDTTE